MSEISPYTNKLRSTKKKKRLQEQRHGSAASGAAGGRDPSGTRRELQAQRHQFLLDRVFAFLDALFSNSRGPGRDAAFTESSFAAALPDGELLCKVAQCVSRRCALDAYDWPRLATITPNGKSRAAAQNHAKFVSFCADIGIARAAVPSLEDVAQRRTERVVQVLLEIEDYVNTHGGAVNVPSSRVRKGSGFCTPTKKQTHRRKGHLPGVALNLNSSPMVKNIARSLTKSGMRFMDSDKDSDCNNDRSDDRQQHHVDTSMLASLSRIEQNVKSARKANASSSSSSAQAQAEAHLLMQQATARHMMTSAPAAAADETPPPSIQNPEHLRHSSKVSSIRKRLLDQKDKDIADLHAKNNAMQRAVASVEAVRQELAAEKKKTKSLQADLDRTRAEVIGQARAGEETAMTTTELRTEVSELEKKLSVANAANAAHERQILRLSSEVKNLEARNVDLASFSADTAESLKRSAEEETGELRARVEALEGKLAAATASLGVANGQCQKLEIDVAEKASHAEEMEAQMNRMRIDLDGFDDRESTLKATIGELEAELAAQQTVVEQAASREREAAREMEAAQQDKQETRAWVVKSAKQLRERIAAVRHAGADVKEEMRAQCASMSVDFAKLGESVVGAISELTGLKDDAVAQYRREQRSRQKVFNELQRRRGNIRVLCRSRPNKTLALKEKEEGAYGTATFTSDTELTVRAKNAKSKNARCYRNYEFDHVFHPSANQEEVYYEVSPMVQSAMDGFHSCIFAYGQTGSGKTYTMQGPTSDPGVYARSLEELFRVVDQRKQTHTYSMSVSMVEIYNETIRDLLRGKKGESWPGGEIEDIAEASEDARKKSDRHAKSDRLRGMSQERHSRKHGSGAPTSAAGSSGTRYGSGSGLAITRGEHGNEVVGATHLPVSCPGDIEYIMQRGQRNRSVGSTSMNEHSSRSHCLLIIEIAGVEVDKQMDIHGKLVMVDLAGSERLSKTEASGARLKEAQNINKSLSALGNVINALKTKAGHVPFRDSKLTHLLQDSLSRDNKALMITQISPTDDDVSETMCTLQFASRVKGVELGAAKKHKSSKGNKAEEMQLKRDLSRMESEHAALSAVIARQTSELAAAEASLADLAAQQTTKITGFSSRVSELESRLHSVGEEVSTHKRKAFTLQKECDAIKATAEEQAKALKKAKKEKSLSKEETESLRSKLETTEAKLKRVKKALEREEKKNGKADAGVGSELTKLSEAVERKGRAVSDLKRRLEEREEQLRASEAKRKALKQRESELIIEHKAALRAQTKEREAVKRRFSKTERAMRREQEEQKREILRMQREQRVARAREERRSSSEQQSGRRSSGSARKKTRKKNVVILEQKDEQQDQHGRRDGLSSSLTPLRIDCDESSASLDLSIVKEIDESGLDQSSISESVDMSLDEASVVVDENASAADSVSNAAPKSRLSSPPAAPSTTSIDTPSIPTPLRSRTNTPRSSTRKKVFKETRTPRSAASKARRTNFKHASEDTASQVISTSATTVAKGGILKKSSFVVATDRAQQLLLWKQQKAAKMAAMQQQQQHSSSRSRKTVAFGPDVADPASSAPSLGKKRTLTPGRKASRPRTSLAKSKSRMSISGKGGSLRKKLSTLGTAVRVRSNTRKAPSSTTKVKASMGGAVRNSTRRSTRSASGWN